MLSKSLRGKERKKIIRKESSVAPGLFINAKLLLNYIDVAA